MKWNFASMKHFHDSSYLLWLTKLYGHFLVLYLYAIYFRVLVIQALTLQAFTFQALFGQMDDSYFTVSSQILSTLCRFSRNFESIPEVYDTIDTKY